MMEMKSRIRVFRSDVTIFLASSNYQRQLDGDTHLFVSISDAKKWVMFFVQNKLNLEKSPTLTWEREDKFFADEVSKFTVGDREVVARIVESNVYEVRE